MRSWDLCAGTRVRDNPEGGCFVAMRSVAAACVLYSAGVRAKSAAGAMASVGPEGGCFVAMRSVAAACLLYSAGEGTEPVLLETGKPKNACRKELLQKLASRLKQEEPSRVFEVPLPNGELVSLPCMPFED